MLQSKAGVENREYKVQRSILADVDAGKISKDELFARAEELMKERLKTPGAPPVGAHKTPPNAKPAAGTIVPPPTAHAPGADAQV
jgi:hypothetical protein